VARAAQGTYYQSERVSRTTADEVRSQAINGWDNGRSGNLQFSPRGLWKLNDTDSISASAFIQSNLGVGGSERTILDLVGSPSYTVADASHSSTTSEVRRFQLQWQRKSAEGSKVELKSSWQHTLRSTEGNYTGWRSDGNFSLQRNSVTDFGESRATAAGRWNQPIGVAHTLAIGWDLERRHRDDLRRVWDNGLERLDNSDGVPFSAHIGRIAAFAQDEWAINEQWSLLPGLRLEEVRTQSTDGAGDINNLASVIAPVLHVAFRLDPKGKDQLKLSVNRSFKLPDLGALSARYVFNTTYEREVTNTPIAADRAGNAFLRPELSSGVDLSWEHYPANGGVLSIGIFSRRIDDLIRQKITLENVPGSAAQRWVSRPLNIGQAHSQGLELEIKGRAEEWLPAWFERDSGIQIRAAASVYQSKLEQIEGPDSRLEAQPPWVLSTGFDTRIKGTGWTLGASLVAQPGYATQQTDRQLLIRSALRTLDAFAAWRIDRSMQMRIGLVNMLAPDSITSNSIDDLDGFSAVNSTRRATLRALNVGLVVRF
jgi:iron complex outermembrane receptor protein